MIMRYGLIAAFSILVAANVVADTCVTPSGPRKMQSANGEWRLVIDQQHATLSRQNRRKARWTLPNEPMRVIVANDGTTITFGSGCSEATGDHDVAIYRPDGTLVRSLAMADLLVAEDVAALPKHWSGAHRIDEEKHQLILEVNGPPRMFELPVSLETGTPLGPIKRHFFVPQFEPVVSVASDRNDPLAARRCEGGIAVSGFDLLSRAIDLPLPPYPAAAVKARIEGDVVLEVKVVPAGSVDSVTVVKPLPFGLDEAARDAARKWRFGPLPRTMCGRFVARFAMRQLPPPPSD
jgi:TonB family protein